MTVTSVGTRPGRVASLRRFTWQHPELGLGLVALAAWAGLAALHPGHLHAAADGVAGLLGWWAAMVVAMMVPPALRMARWAGVNSTWQRRQRAVFLFAGSSLLVWLALGAAAAVVGTMPQVAGNRRWALGGAMLLAAAWELTPHKRRALKACHRTIPLPATGRKADKAAVRLGLLYSRSCFRACWALMLPMVVAPHVSPVLMAGLTTVAAAEELVYKGYRLAPAAATFLLSAGLMVLVLG